MANTGEIIKYLRKKYGYTQEELGNMVGVQKSAIAKYENGRVENLKRATIEKLASIFDVSPSYILGIDDNEDIKLPHSEPVITLNVYSPLSCGTCLFVEDNITSVITLPKSMFPAKKKDLFAQYADGDSMVDCGICDGDLLVFSKELCESGDIGCFCIDENIATCKKLRILDNQILLMPCNDKYDPIPVEPDKFKCVGKLVLKISKEK